MKPSKIRSIAIHAALMLAAGAAVLPAIAQTTSTLPPALNKTAPPPPRLEKLEEVDAPGVTITQPGEVQKKDSITEKREQGQVTEVKVESSGSTYYLRPRNVGSSQPGDAQSGPPTNAQWSIKEFDWGGKKKKPTAPSDAMPAQ